MFSNNLYGAICDFTAVIENNPSYEGGFAYFQRAFCKEELKDYYGAEADYSKAIELSPDFAFYYVQRGSARENLGYLYGACADWRKAASLGYTDAAQWVRNQCN